MGPASGSACTAETGLCTTGGWRGTSISRTLWEKVAIEYDTDELRLLRRSRGELETGASKKRTYIENVILRPSQISSLHHPRPGSSFPSEKKMRVGHRLSQAIPPRFFARAGSVANSSSLPYIAEHKKGGIKNQHCRQNSRSKKGRRMHVLPRSIRVVVSPRQERRVASEVAHLLLCFFVDRQHANCK